MLSAVFVTFQWLILVFKTGYFLEQLSLDTLIHLMFFSTLYRRTKTNKRNSMSYSNWKSKAQLQCKLLKFHL